jgi:hypothetical protein
MARKVNAFLMTICLIFAVDAMAITGNEWKQLTPAGQQAYVAGVIDTWNGVGQRATVMKKMGHGGSLNELFFTDLHECVSVRNRMPYGQIVAIVKKYMDNNPSGWHYSMADSVYEALSEACK